MIFSDLGIHDKRQFELKLEYLIEGKKSTIHDLDVFYVLPSNLDVNVRTFRSEQFYESLQNYIRIKTPEFSLIELINSNASIYDQFNGVNNPLDKKEVNKLVQSLKLFGCIFNSSLRSYYESRSFDSEKEIQSFLKFMQAPALHFRRSRENLKKGNSKKVIRVYNAVDEYNSITLEHYYFSLLEQLKSINKDLLSEFKPTVLKLIENEQVYRKKSFIESITGSRKENEAFLSSKNSLKKYIQSVLFLNKEDTRQSQRLEQVALMLAAGIAMVFATGSIIFFHLSTTHFSWTTFMLFVLSYMFKDRIKDWIKVYFKRKIQSRFFDFITVITTEENKTVTKIKRNFKFINKDELPNEGVNTKLFSWMPKLELSWGMHSILHYKNRIKVLNPKLRQVYSTHKVRGIVEIFRFNIEPFMKRIDDAKEEIFVLNKDDYKAVKTMRTYHFYLIMKESGEGMSFTKFWRIEFNRSGIQSVNVMED